MVVVPRDGPTSKADCLNEVIAAIFDHEIKNEITFAGIAMHDAEDLIHPHELKLFNLLIGKYDFIQLPVLSFNQPLREFVAGISMDEFAEVHTKDLVVREHLSGVVPCAGVSACFSRRAMAMLVEYNGVPFDTSCFTEDYDVAFRMHELGLQTDLRVASGRLHHRHGPRQRARRSMCRCAGRSRRANSSRGNCARPIASARAGSSASSSRAARRMAGSAASAPNIS